MRSRYRIIDSEGVYFLTCTIVAWIPIFTTPTHCSILIDSLAYCRKSKGLRLYAYVIMENHLHLVAQANDLAPVIQAFKRHTAQQIVDAAKADGREWLLSQLAYYKKAHKMSSTFQVWQEGSHPQLIQGDSMLRQKIEYVHANPVRRGWVDAPEQWRYSSARNYHEVSSHVLEIDALPL